MSPLTTLTPFLELLALIFSLLISSLHFPPFCSAPFLTSSLSSLKSPSDLYIT
ncbi:hypothetical protein GQ43DRAFT_441911 [Delitschia confertaspora ATCC 74209]|uniref:Uncharacterized protein n=1 Tax=Delitschia confertaspora ATCC 74209 TaxID=1513339 RepID=A0A9P4JIJ7_9PLEO|nr:hypothetical protein GQ43DRAFT_441911 [Delitschia confertaspora ATCC 74209]